jgi:FK506-binding protein 9/10
MKLLSLLLSQLVAEGEEIEVQSIFTPSECTRKVEKGDFVRYHYSGYFDDGSWFDDSFSRGSTYNTYVGSGWLIPGMDMGKGKVS